MSVTRMFRLSFVVAFAMACSSDSTSPTFRRFVYSAAVDECGPADGPAVGIYLAPSPTGAIDRSTPFVRVYVPGEVDQLTGVWSVAGAHAQGAAWFHPDASAIEPAESGYLIVSSVDADKTITGSVNLDFPEAGHISIEFRATWVQEQALCI